MDNHRYCVNSTRIKYNITTINADSYSQPLYLAVEGMDVRLEQGDSVKVLSRLDAIVRIELETTPRDKNCVIIRCVVSEDKDFTFRIDKEADKEKGRNIVQLISHNIEKADNEKIELFDNTNFLDS